MHEKKKKKKRKAINKKKRNNTAEYKKNAYVIVSHFNRMMAKPIKAGWRYLPVNGRDFFVKTIFIVF